MAQLATGLRCSMAFKSNPVVSTRASRSLRMQVTASFEAGSKIRVKSPVTIFTVPKKQKEGFNLAGLEGTVVQDVSQYKGQKLSANLTIKVQFILAAEEENGKPTKFVAHLDEAEIEAV